MANLKYNLSYWERESFLKDIDVVVVGSGIVGLAAAIHLKTQKPNLKVVVLERGALPIGASTRNAGFACFGSMTELLDDMQKMEPDAVLTIVEKRWRGLQRLRELVGDENLDFRMNGGFEMFTEEEEPTWAACLERREWFNAEIGRITGHPAVYVPADEKIARFGFQGISHLLHNQAEGQVHTGKMVSALLRLAQMKNIPIYNGLSVEHIEDEGARGVTLQVGFGWRLQAAKVLVAVNGFAQRLLPGAEVWPARNQVLITQPIADLPVEGCFHYDRGYFYFRNIDGRVLLGGGRNLAAETEQTDVFGMTELIKSALVQLLKTVILPGRPVEIDTWWSGILGLGPVKKPIVQRVSSNLFVSVRLSGMGVAIGTLVGQEGADLVLADF